LRISLLSFLSLPFFLLIIVDHFEFPFFFMPRSKHDERRRPRLPTFKLDDANSKTNAPPSSFSLPTTISTTKQNDSSYNTNEQICLVENLMKDRHPKQQTVKKKKKSAEEEL